MTGPGNEPGPEIKKETLEKLHKMMGPRRVCPACRCGIITIENIETEEFKCQMCGNVFT